MADPLARALLILFFPAVLAGLWCWIVWLRTPLRKRSDALAYLAFVLFLIPPLLVVIGGSQSSLLIIPRDGVFVFMGARSPPDLIR